MHSPVHHPRSCCSQLARSPLSTHVRSEKITPTCLKTLSLHLLPGPLLPHLLPRLLRPHLLQGPLLPQLLPRLPLPLSPLHLLPHLLLRLPPPPPHLLPRLPPRLMPPYVTRLPSSCRKCCAAETCLS